MNARPAASIEVTGLRKQFGAQGVLAIEDALCAELLAQAGDLDGRGRPGLHFCLAILAIRSRSSRSLV